MTNFYRIFKKICNPRDKIILSYKKSMSIIHSDLSDKIIYGNSTDDNVLNVEHIYPRQYFKHNNEIKSDLHNLYLCTVTMNNLRGNYKYGNLYDNTNINHENNIFEPENKSKGNIARACAYIYCAYPEGHNVLKIINKETIIKWNMAHPVSKKEMKRNDIIESHQRNRNPFIDLPHMIECIF